MANTIELTGFVNFKEEVNGGGNKFALSVGVKNIQSGEYDKNGTIRCYAGPNVNMETLEEGKLTTITGFMSFSFRDKTDASGEPEVGQNGKVKYVSTPQIIVMSVNQE